MKIVLELNCLEDGRKFLNFWDFERGKDVVCQIIDDVRTLGHIPLSEFVNQVLKAKNGSI